MSLFGRFTGRVSGRASPARVHPRDSRARFADFIASAEVGFPSLDVPAALRVLCDFYRTVPADGCRSQDEDGDMLLCQWGVHDWGHGESFEFDFVRQFNRADADDDDAISQLQLTLYFPASEVLQGLGAGHRWCSEYGELDAFEAAVSGSAPYRALADATPERVELRWGQV